MTVALLLLLTWSGLLAGQIVERPFLGVTHIARSETHPRKVNMHIVLIDLEARGIRFKLTSPAGPLETVRRTTLQFLNQEHAQVAINSHFFLPYPSRKPHSLLVGLAASNGAVYSAFESPRQSYALVADAPALNIDARNRASIVHRDKTIGDGKHVIENVTLWNAVSGSAQIVTNGVKTIPVYADQQHPDGALTPGGRRKYSNALSWYDVPTARTSIGLTEDTRTLVLFTVDRAAGSLGLKVGEVADLLIKEYAVYNALNLDGGGSTTLAMQNPVTGKGVVRNVPSDKRGVRPVASSLAVFAASAPPR
ncbi:MAG TPA: phosphodiester glycosidase family protein [Bryobacteraceae bacterium]|jgi:hypothetical protein|nr:phosphodiester glycosidase family protein [Bryobacteraceae bacterium]